MEPQSALGFSHSQVLLGEDAGAGPQVQLAISGQPEVLQAGLQLRFQAELHRWPWGGAHCEASAVLLQPLSLPTTL